MRRIVDDTWQITYPPYLSPPAIDLIGRLLERRPARRIGAVPAAPACSGRGYAAHVQARLFK